ncbi:MAG: carbohydrate kinase family protein [Candidatus Buchananbacteria bacterium]|nr:carbohydrate kinase family protein [Candidatus Buchananbacteria bacterium]
MAKFDIITIGGAIKDFTLYTNQGKVFNTPQNLTAQKMLAFEYGAKFLIKDVSLNFGGGASNAAVALAKLNLKTAIITHLGNDEISREVSANLKQHKVSTDLITFDRLNPTGFSFIIAVDKKEREHVAFSCRNSDEYLKITPASLAKVKTDWFYITSLYGKNWQTNLKAVFKFARDNNIKVAWNPGTQQLQAGKRIIGEFIKQTTVLVLNKDEAIELVLSGIKLGKKSPNYLNRHVYLLNILQEWGPKIVVITDGAKGAWAYDGKKIYHQKVVKAKIIDTTGVGDAFGSSFVSGLIKHHFNISKALRRGAINSSAVTKEIGAQNGLLTEKKLLEKL